MPPQVAHGAQRADANPAMSVTERTMLGALDVVVGLHPLWCIVAVMVLA